MLVSPQTARQFGLHPGSTMKISGPQIELSGSLERHHAGRRRDRGAARPLVDVLDRRPDRARAWTWRRPPQLGVLGRRGVRRPGRDRRGAAGLRPGGAGPAVGVPDGVRLARRAAGPAALRCAEPARRPVADADRGRRAGRRRAAGHHRPAAAARRVPGHRPGGGHPAVAAVREPGGGRPGRPPARRPHGRDAPVGGAGDAPGARRVGAADRRGRRPRCRRGRASRPPPSPCSSRCCSSPGRDRGWARDRPAAGCRRSRCCSSRSAPRPPSRPGSSGCPGGGQETGAARAPGRGWSPRRPPWRRRSPGSSSSGSRARSPDRA